VRRRGRLSFSRLGAEEYSVSLDFLMGGRFWAILVRQFLEGKFLERRSFLEGEQFLDGQKMIRVVVIANRTL
jgi:hypothetical protein